MRSAPRVTAFGVLLLGCAGDAPPVLPAPPAPASTRPAAPATASIPSPPGECAGDADCVLVAHDPDAPKPCCTCTLRAVTGVEARRIEKLCSAPAAPSTPLRDTICIQSCLRAPGLAARCVDGVCAMR